MTIVDSSSSIPKHLIHSPKMGFFGGQGDFRFMQQAEVRIFSRNSFWVMWSVIISSKCHANHGIACQIKRIFAPRQEGANQVKDDTNKACCNTCEVVSGQYLLWLIHQRSAFFTVENSPKRKRGKKIKIKMKLN